jgi:DNA mismatch endonuclease (patch repair protein)
MRQVKGSNTAPELALRKALFALGARGWRCHRKELPGKPDLVFSRAKVAVFVDGGFWHGHPKKFRPGQSGVYWDRKIARNMERDKAANLALKRDGWKVLRFWDFDVTRDPFGAAGIVVDALASGAGRS